MRSLKELYGLVIERINSNNYPGICSAMTHIYISDVISHEEYLLIQYHFESTPRPTAESHPQFAKYLTPESWYYFDYGLKEPRIAFLKEIQNSLPNN